MLKHLKAFFKEEDGLGTVEIVLILVVLISLAIIFKEAILGFFNTIIGDIQGQEENFKIDTMTGSGSGD